MIIHGNENPQESNRLRVFLLNVLCEFFLFFQAFQVLYALWYLFCNMRLLSSSMK